MRYYIGCDAHKKYSQLAVMDEAGQIREQTRVIHERGAIRHYLEQFPLGTPVAVETVGNWYWIGDEIERAGCQPLLVQARKAKATMGHLNKTDKLDAKGLATLVRNGTVPTVWIPPTTIRDERELLRTRMFFTRMRTALKNRIHATFAKYGIRFESVSDLFGPKGRAALGACLKELPPQTRRCVALELQQINSLAEEIELLEERIRAWGKTSPNLQWLQTLPGVGLILAAVIEREVGSVGRFPDAQRFCGYCGTVPKVHSSGGKTRYGALREDGNQYLKWALVEAANVVARQRQRWQARHVVRLYERIRQRKGHAKAVGAVARHLAEAAYWMLKKQEPYQEPHGTVLPQPR